MSCGHWHWEGGAVPFCFVKITQQANTDTEETVSSFTFRQMWFIWITAKYSTQRTQCDGNQFWIKYEKQKSKTHLNRASSFKWLNTIEVFASGKSCRFGLGDMHNCMVLFAVFSLPENHCIYIFNPVYKLFLLPSNAKRRLPLQR